MMFICGYCGHPSRRGTTRPPFNCQTLDGLIDHLINFHQHTKILAWKMVGR